jgi:4-hydroxymandelate oxidase
MMKLREFDFPQGLKPKVYAARNGTAEAVPFQIVFMRPVLGLPIVVDQRYSAPIGSVVDTPAQAWLKVYVQSDRALARDLGQWARASGYRCLFVRYASPEVRRLCLPTSDQRFDRNDTPPFSAAIGWKYVEWLRSDSRLPVILTGISSERDCEIAMQLGIEGVAVSCLNAMHSPLPVVEILARTSKIVQGRVPIILEADLRSGVDVVKALALGASAVVIGRAATYALAVRGPVGVKQLLEALGCEIEHIMAVLGCRSIGQIDHAILRDRSIATV